MITKLKGFIFLTALISTSVFSSATPYMGEISWVAFNYAPFGWLPCDGQTLAINSYPDLYNVIGTTYGGDGVTTFVLPDMRGRIPISRGTGSGLSNRVVGEQGGTEMKGSALSNTYLRDYGLTQKNGRSNLPTDTTRDLVSALKTSSLTPENNMQPFLSLNCIINYDGSLPSPLQKLK